MADPYEFTPAVGSALTTTTSNQAIPGLTQNVVTGATYLFEVHFYYQGGTASSSSFSATMAGTCTATMVAYHVAIQTNANGTSNHQTHSALNASASGASAVAAASTNYACVIRGAIKVSGSGTLTVQAKHVTAACTVQSGGVFTLRQVA
jgi:hypothetical protein